MTLRRCCTCEEKKPTTEFYRTGPGYERRCKACSRAHAKAYKAEFGYTREKARRADNIAAGLRHDGKPKLGHSLRPRQTPLVAAAKRIHILAYHRSRLRNVPFTLTLDWVIKAVADFAETHYHEFTPASPWAPSLDKIERSGIYEEGNVRVCWLIENLCRNSFTDADVLKFCRLKLEEHKKKGRTD